jgi:hypothetical protein
MGLSIDNPASFARTMSGYYSDEWLTWTPEATEVVLTKEFDYDPSSREIDAIEAVKELLRSDRTMYSPLVFEKVIRLLAGETASFEVWEGISPEELIVGMAQARRIVGGEHFDESLTRAARGYIASTLVADDIHAAPEELHLDPVLPELRSLSSVDPSVRQRISSAFSEVMDGPSSDIEDRLRAVAAGIQDRADMSSPQGGSEAQEEGRFIRQQVGRLVSLALILRRENLL